MPKPYPPQFRRRALDLLETGRSVRDVAASLGIAQSCLHHWKSRDLLDRGVRGPWARRRSRPPRCGRGGPAAATPDRRRSAPLPQRALKPQQAAAARRTGRRGAAAAPRVRGSVPRGADQPPGGTPHRADRDDAEGVREHVPGRGELVLQVVPIRARRARRADRARSPRRSTPIGADAHSLSPGAFRPVAPAGRAPCPFSSTDVRFLASSAGPDPAGDVRRNEEVRTWVR